MASELVLLCLLTLGALRCAANSAQATDSGLPYGVEILSIAVSPNYEKD